MCVEPERVTSAVYAALNEALFVLGSQIQYAGVPKTQWTLLHALGLQNIFLATSLLGIIQTKLGLSAVITVGLEEQIACNPTMTVGDLIMYILDTNT